jgi:hypothetical protein
MITYEQAREIVVRQMLPVTENHLALGCRAKLDDALSVEYEWGWSFTFVPVDPAECSKEYKFDSYAVDRVTGFATPIGNKGIPEAVNYLMKWRQKRQEAANQQQAGSRTTIAKSSQAEPGAAPDPAS